MTYPNLTIPGIGKHPGGSYQDVCIAGSGKLCGAVECRSFTCAGVGKLEGGLRCETEILVAGGCKIEGPVRTGTLSVPGALKIEGSLQSGAISVAGSLKVEGETGVEGEAAVHGSLKAEDNLRVGRLELHGVCSAEGTLTAQSVDSKGILKLERDVQAERFVSHGIVKIGGLLNAEQVELQLSGGSEIGAIGGGSVNVRAAEDFFRLRGKDPMLTVRLIEADEISLESTLAETVRGGSVQIGPGCHIDHVEYSGSLTVHPEAEVGTQTKI